MTIYAVGDEPESYTTTSNASGSTVAKDPLARGGASTIGSTPSDLDLKTSISEVWVRALLNVGSNVVSTTDLILSLYNSANARDVVRIMHTGAEGTYENFEVQYNSSGSTYTKIGSFPFRYRTLASNTSNEIQMYFKLGTSGAVKIYARNKLVFSATGNFTANDATFDFVRVGGSTTTNVGGVIVSSTEMFGWALNHLHANSPGTNSGWTNASGGSVSTAHVIDTTGATAIDQTTQIKTDTIGSKLSFNIENPAAIPAARDIKAFSFACAGVIQAGSGISSISQLLRSSSTDYTQDNCNFGTTIKGYSQVVETDPASGLKWTRSTVNALQLGVIAG